MCIDMPPIPKTQCLKRIAHTTCAQEGVRTLSVRVGVPRVFWACIGMLEAAYLGAICMGLTSQARLALSAQDFESGRPVYGSLPGLAGAFLSHRCLTAW